MNDDGWDGFEKTAEESPAFRKGEESNGKVHTEERIYHPSKSSIQKIVNK